jgi:hypothetical protein
MTSNTIQYQAAVKSDPQYGIALARGWLAAFDKFRRRWIFHSSLASARRSMELKRMARTQADSDILRALPLEDKLRLGMYRIMD